MSMPSYGVYHGGEVWFLKGIGQDIATALSHTYADLISKRIYADSQHKYNIREYASQFSFDKLPSKILRISQPFCNHI